MSFRPPAEDTEKDGIDQYIFISLRVSNGNVRLHRTMRRAHKVEQCPAHVLRAKTSGCTLLRNRIALIH